jgi:hypothetical protein
MTTGVPGRELPEFQGGNYRSSREAIPEFQGGNYRSSREAIPEFQGGYTGVPGRKVAVNPYGILGFLTGNLITLLTL